MTDTLDPTDRLADVADLPIRRPNDNPYLAGNLAPVPDEVTAFDLPTAGEIPAELEGRWLRNGPNPESVADPLTHHWFLGTGMVHGVRLRGGKAEWYRNRFVLDPADRAAGLFGANTNVGGFAGTTWAMVEGGQPPIELGYELEPKGVNRFHGTLDGPFTAHPKYDPSTGELHSMNYHWPDLIDHVEYTVVGGDGRVTKSLAIPVNDMPMIHDMSLTDKYAIVYDLSVTVNLEVLTAGYAFPFKWDPDRPCRVGLLPRDGGADDIIWCDVDPCYVFHPLNAYDAADGTVVVDVCRYDAIMVDDRQGPFRDHLATLDRWIIDPVARRVRETRLDDRPQEFPRHNPRFGLKQHRFGYTSEVIASEHNIHGAIIKTDTDTGSTETHEFGHGRGGAEPVFVPKADGTAEDAGWILTVVYDAATDQSELHILDAEDISGPEVAAIQLPQRVPFGFHGNWVPDTSVAPT
ncbi:carotenoid oxygenase family protein [Ilumatobacter nonamiensis]|uniref:carotenoid oxygenase family protein n=1 Tax=Ilumatobacter nonamiensis TaxID=467093 RepID=UPI000688780F|nr:carotenoid oxygenase family protein [Ilumatobacter nonamiensis]